MNAELESRIKSQFFAFGIFKRTIFEQCRSKLETLPNLKVLAIGEETFAFYSNPTTVNRAENDQIICFQTGYFHENLERFVRSEEFLSENTVSRERMNLEKIWGNGVVITIDKHSPQIECFRSLLSIPTLYYWMQGENIIFTDNLRLMVELLPTRPGLNEDILPAHFLFLSAQFEHGYIKDIHELRSGVGLKWQAGKLDVQLKRTFRDFPTSPGRTVNPEMVDLFYEKFKALLSLLISENKHNIGTSLSGGIDSSLILATAADLEIVDFQFPTYSYLIDTPAFKFETEYAGDAINAFNAQPYFMEITPEDFYDSLIEGTQLLAQPLPFDVPACFLSLARHLDQHDSVIERLFHGQLADGLHGTSSSLQVIQGDKYRNWPIPLLSIMGMLLAQISQSKSYGARAAANTLRQVKQINSPQSFLNRPGLYTDLDAVYRIFDQDAIHGAFLSRREIAEKYMPTDVIVEHLNTIGIMTSGLPIATLEYQLAIPYKRQYILPYVDEAIIKETFAFDPLERYCADHRVKPILKSALGKRAPLKVINSEKGYSTLINSVKEWMKDGILREITHAIERPGFISAADFKNKIENPDWFTWKLLMLDLFKKHVLN